MVLDLFFHLNRHKYKILSRWQLNLHQSSYPKSGWKVLCMPLPHVGGCRAQELHGTGGWLGDGRGQWWVGDKGPVMGDKGWGRWVVWGWGRWVVWGWGRRVVWGWMVRFRVVWGWLVVSWWRFMISRLVDRWWWLLVAFTTVAFGSSQVITGANVLVEDGSVRTMERILPCHRHGTSDISETLVGHVSLVCIDHVSSYLATGFFVSVKGLVMSATTVEWSIGIMSHDFDWSDLLWFILVIQKDWTLGFVRSWLISWMWRSSISWFRVPVGWLRVAIGWLRMAVGWLRVAVGWLRMAVGWLRVAVSWFRMAIGGFWVMVGWFGVTIGWFRMAISWLGVAVVGT